jgi:transposase
MDFVGLDVSLKPTAICIVDRTGKIVREGVVTSDPVTIATFIKSHAPHLARPCRDAGVVDGTEFRWTREAVAA